MTTNWRALIGESLFEYELIIYSFLMGTFLYAVIYAYPNMLGSMWAGLHALDLVQLMAIVIMMRALLPHTVKGAFYSVTAGLFAPLSGETIFMPFYWYWLSRFDSSLPIVGGVWMVGQWGFLLLWAVFFMTRTYHLFKTKWLIAGVITLLPVMFFWKYYFNFFLWNYATTPYELFIGDVYTVIYYTIWCVFFTMAFNPKGFEKI